MKHCDHWADGDGPCCRCGQPSWCPHEGETAHALAEYEHQKNSCPGVRVARGTP